MITIQKVTITEIEIEEFPEVDTKYVDIKTGKKYRSRYSPDITDKTGDEVTSVEEKTGRILERKTETVIFEQLFGQNHPINVSTVVSFLNDQNAQ